VQNRVREIAARPVTRDGVLIVTSGPYRSQLRNREGAHDQFVASLRLAVQQAKASETPAE
jgi:hypothetical protein